MAPRSKAVLAREHLDRALPAVAAEDHAEAVAWLFVSIEAAIVAVADAQGLDTKKAHWRKAEVATELHASGALPVDYADTLKLLNEARKAVFYEGEDPDLGGQSLDDIALIVESAVEQAEQVAAQ
jgi:predicted AAA+ superfamily ATPase